MRHLILSTFFAAYFSHTNPSLYRVIYTWITKFDDRVSMLHVNIRESLFVNLLKCTRLINFPAYRVTQSEKEFIFLCFKHFFSTKTNSYDQPLRKRMYAFFIALKYFDNDLHKRDADPVKKRWKKQKRMTEEKLERKIKEQCRRSFFTRC